MEGATNYNGWGEAPLFQNEITALILPMFLNN
jgi:hypothetical protein